MTPTRVIVCDGSFHRPCCAGWACAWFDDDGLEQILGQASGSDFLTSSRDAEALAVRHAVALALVDQPKVARLYNDCRSLNTLGLPMRVLWRADDNLGFLGRLHRWCHLEAGRCARAIKPALPHLNLAGG